MSLGKGIAIAGIAGSIAAVAILRPEFFAGLAIFLVLILVMGSI